MTSDFEHLRWSVERRTKALSALVDLYEFMDNDPRAYEEDQTRWLCYQMVGIGFSLWRAAFLLDTEREQKPIFEKTKLFLDEVIRNNAINYPQERRIRDWSSGYYINNARYRIYILGDQVSALISKEDFRRAYEIPRGTSVNVNLKDLWEKLIGALIATLDFAKEK